ncbi:MAG: hypothetical protein JO166_17105 [Deltaproteobacteria bacterium]|nr:hypothetical protein [Deltaproteobacteria bacterium]
MNSIRFSHSRRRVVVGDAASQPPRIPRASIPVHQVDMLSPFDWYTVIAIGIAAEVVAAALIIAWLTGQIRPRK